jgi:hypothetical protein
MEDKRKYVERNEGWNGFDIRRENLNGKVSLSLSFWNSFDKELKDLEKILDKIMTIANLDDAGKFDEINSLFDLCKNMERSQDEDKICTALHVFSEGGIHNFENSWL